LLKRGELLPPQDLMFQDLDNEVDTIVVGLLVSNSAARRVLRKWHPSPQQVEQQRHPGGEEEDEADPHENIERFLLRRRSVDPDSHVKTTNQTSQESHHRATLYSDGNEHLPQTQ